MPRLNRVKKARKEQNCERGDTIAVGSPYVWWKNRTAYGGHRHARCMDHMPKGSEMASSPYTQLVLSIGEDAPTVDEGNLSGGSEEFSSYLSEAAERVRDEGAEALRESSQNIIEGFGHETSQSEELEERAQEFDDWADTLESAAGEIEMTDLEPLNEAEPAERDFEHAVDYMGAHEEWTSAIESVVDEIETHMGAAEEGP